MTTQSLTGEEIDELERLLAEADIHPLPWRAPTLLTDQASEGHCVDAAGRWVCNHDSWEGGNLAVAAVNALPRLIAALKASRQSPGEGFVLVPAKSTPEIVEAMRQCTIRNSRAADPSHPFESPWECAVALFAGVPTND